MARQEELESEWTISSVDHVGSRMAYLFNSVDYGADVQVRISVSRTFANPEAEAWRVLGKTVQ